MHWKPTVNELEAQIREVIHELLAVTVTPHVRELRAKAVTYGRVIGGWATYPPTDAQRDAMAECLAELHAKVMAVKADGPRAAPSSRAPSAIDRPRERAPRASEPPTRARDLDPHDAAPPPPLPRHAPAERPTVPPPSGVPYGDPFDAARDDSDNSGVRPRAPRIAKRDPDRASSLPPGGTLPPTSRTRPAPSDTRPTPVPALLQNRRSRG